MRATLERLTATRAQARQPVTRGPEETDQFLNAFERLLAEALEGDRRDTRDFLFDTAIPALMASGTSPYALLGGQVTFFVVLTNHLLCAVPAGLREEATFWLAGFL